MDTSEMTSPNWFRAARLPERLAAKRSAAARDGHAGPAGDEARGRRRLERWRTQAPFAEGTAFSERLAMDGLGEPDLVAMLGEPEEAVRALFSETPSWLEATVRALRAERDPGSPLTPLADVPLPEEVRNHAMLPALPAFARLVDPFRARLRSGAREILLRRPRAPFDPDTVADLLFGSVPLAFLRMVGRALALEINVFRLEGRLRGETAPERFQEFFRVLSGEGRLEAFLEEYPVLARSLVESLDSWARNGLEFLERLAADWDDVRATFRPEAEPGRLTDVEGGVGDRHRGGRSVLIARFASGFRVVYKPRPLDVDGHFAELLAWLDERGAEPEFRSTRVLRRAEHGWAEFLAPSACESPEGVARFYLRQGGYLALLHVLEATDFHFENLIAVGEHPMLVDLEALFHPHADLSEDSEADVLAGNVLGESVLRVGLLPVRVRFGNEDSDGLDLSGLGGASGQKTPYKVPFWESGGTDEVRLGRKQMEIGGAEHRPTLQGASVEVLDHADALVRGFTPTYRLLLAHRAELLSETGPIARFAGDEVRIILRSTMRYAFTQWEGYHPDFLRDALDRERFLDRLFIGSEKLPFRVEVIRAEREDLWAEDIPMFTTRPNSRHVWDSRGRLLPDFLKQSSLDRVFARIAGLSEADLAQQILFVRSSLATLAVDGEESLMPSYTPTESAEAPPRRALEERLLSAARRIGDALASKAIRGERGDAAWIGMTLTNERFWALAPLGADLFEGMPGMALFFGRLAQVTGDERYRLLARGSLTTLRRQLQRGKGHLESLGAFSGWGGVLYALAHVGAALSDEGLLSEASAYARLLPPLVDGDVHLDVVGGSAGAILGLLGLHRVAPADELLSTAVACGERLLARARTMPAGIGWITFGADTVPLCGMSHGASGIALSLARLAEATGDRRFLDAAHEAVRYERSRFDAEAGNWPDLRDIAEDELRWGRVKQDFMVAWCHGAPGIGLARVGLLGSGADALVREDLARAVETTLAHGFGKSHAICHGDLGNLLFLQEAAEALDDAGLRTRVDRLAWMILDSVERHGLLCGIPTGIDSPGLMTGHAGIGLALLTLGAPDAVPSVLSLAPPASRLGALIAPAEPIGRSLERGDGNR